MDRFGAMEVLRFRYNSNTLAMIAFIIRYFLGEIRYFISYVLNFKIKFLFLDKFFILAVQYISFNYFSDL